jgi:hypothetical protein
MEHGACKLCLKEADLLDSHYLPKRVYSMNMAKTLKNPNPVTLAHGQAKQISDQLRGHTFCAECENRLSKYGEQWALAHMPKDYKEPFPLQDALIPAKPAIFGDNINIYEGRKLAAFDMDQLIYFGMSVFWRGACREWKSSKGAVAPSVDLGERYEPIRKFLLGGPFPQNVHIVVLIHNLKPVGNAAIAVQRGESGFGDFYWFYVNGFGFMLYLGEQFPQDAESQCAQHGVNGPVVVDRAFSNMVYAFFKELLEGSKKSEGVMGLLKTSQTSSSDIGKQSQ